jgi:hypothetical protein
VHRSRASDHTLVRVRVDRDEDRVRRPVILRLDARTAHGSGARLRELGGGLASARVELDDEHENRSHDHRARDNRTEAFIAEDVEH